MYYVDTSVLFVYTLAKFFSFGGASTDTKGSSISAYACDFVSLHSCLRLSGILRRIYFLILMVCQTWMRNLKLLVCPPFLEQDTYLIFF
jgi:hypothetical protein